MRTKVGVSHEPWLSPSPPQRRTNRSLTSRRCAQSRGSGGRSGDGLGGGRPPHLRCHSPQGHQLAPRGAHCSSGGAGTPGGAGHSERPGPWPAFAPGPGGPRVLHGPSSRDSRLRAAWGWGRGRLCRGVHVTVPGSRHPLWVLDRVDPATSCWQRAGVGSPVSPGRRESKHVI